MHASPTPSWTAYARDVIAHVVRCSDAPLPVAPAPDRPHNGAFVTLRIRNRLRGCMGVLDPNLPLSEAVRHAAVSASTQDPRFAPVDIEELADLRIEVSIMTEPKPMKTLDDLELGRHGVIVQSGARRGLFLPKVATDFNFTKEQFLSRCCSEKAGLPADAWRDPQTTVLLFETEIHSDNA